MITDNLLKRWFSVVGVATTHGQQVVGFKSTEVGKWFSVLEIRPDRRWGPPSFLFSRYWRSLEAVKRPELQANRTPPPSAKFTNKWSDTSSSRVCFHGVYKCNVTFLSAYTYMEQHNSCRLLPEFYVSLTLHLGLYLYNETTRCIIYYHFIESPGFYMFRDHL
jgi:hypothetical protein